MTLVFWALRNWRLMGIGLAIATVLTILGSFWWKHTSLQEEVNRWRTEDAQRDQAQAQRNQTEVVIGDLQRRRLEALRERHETEVVFRSHDLEKLAAAKPGLIQTRVNSGTADALRMFECITRDSCGSATAEGSKAIPD